MTKSQSNIFLTPQKQQQSQQGTAKLQTHGNQKYGSPLTKDYFSDRFIPLRPNQTARNLFNCKDDESKMISQNVKKQLNLNQLDVNINYQSMLQSEILYQENSSQRNKSPSSIKSNSMLQYKSTPKKKYDYEITQSPISQFQSEFSTQESYKKITKMPQKPFKVLQANGLADNFYFNLIDWSSNDVVAVSLPQQIHLFDVKKQESTCLIDYQQDYQNFDQEQHAVSIKFSPNGKVLTCGSYHGNLEIFDVEKLQIIKNQKSKHELRIGKILYLNDNLVATGSKDYLIKITDLRVPYQEVFTLKKHQGEICGLAWNQNNFQVYYNMPGYQAFLNLTLFFYLVFQKKSIEASKNNFLPKGKALIPKSKQSYQNIFQLASGGNDNEICIWNLRYNNSQPETVLHGHKAAIKALNYLPNNNLISGGGRDDNSIKIWNSFSFNQMENIETLSQVTNLHLTKNWMISTHGYLQNDINLWDIESMNHQQSLQGHSQRVIYSAISADFTKLVTGSGDETLRFWNVDNKCNTQLNEQQDCTQLSLIR